METFFEFTTCASTRFQESKEYLAVAQPSIAGIAVFHSDGQNVIAQDR